MSLNPSAPDQFYGADPHLVGFEEAKRDLLMADSVNERANAAFKLGLLGNNAVSPTSSPRSTTMRLKCGTRPLNRWDNSVTLRRWVHSDFQHREGSN